MAVATPSAQQVRSARTDAGGGSAAPDNCKTAHLFLPEASMESEKLPQPSPWCCLSQRQAVVDARSRAAAELDAVSNLVWHAFFCREASCRDSSCKAAALRSEPGQMLTRFLQLAGDVAVSSPAMEKAQASTLKPKHDIRRCLWLGGLIHLSHHFLLWFGECNYVFLGNDETVCIC